MTKHSKWLLAILLSTCIIYASNIYGQSIKISIPLGGNCFITSKEKTTDSIADAGIVKWAEAATVFSIYFRNDQPCIVQLGLADASKGRGSISALVDENKTSFSFNNKGAEVFDKKRFQLTPGYHHIQLKGLKKTGENYAIITDLLLKTDAPDSIFHFVRENSGSRYYWGRRGPSLHLNYQAPEDKNIEWFYNELTVNKGDDAIGSYFMANGFKEGYFGMQVNSDSERHILFSVWSPYSTDDPASIPDDEKIVLLKKGKNVHAGEFGSEGSGGQSYMNYPWTAGNTYRFLTHVKPDDKGNTVFTSYFFAPEEKEWMLLASFQRPKTDTWLTRPHSFVENFIDSIGLLHRRCFYGNQWALDTEGYWHELTTAFFTGDDIANVHYRMDYKAGVDGNTFFLQNGGFSSDYTPLKQYFSRRANKVPPKIDFDKLP
ncbi:MAG TPA: DUF3472 domain-containing protein [Panacibacter sp.]|nr:DUF3472 domain-containing protein [Panacibacter sp.]HNP45144.1 DUF3472 domain-containing protein [Panacibacter sp.]